MKNRFPTVESLDAYEKEFGYKSTANIIKEDSWNNHIHPDDRAGILNDYNQMLMSTATEWKCVYRCIKADGSVANIISGCVVLRDSNGKVYRMIGSMHDVSKQKVLEDKLENEILLKEKQIEQATQEAKEIERSNLGKELHDNINQLLGASKMYLEMAKKGNGDSEMYLAKSTEYTLTAIEEIRNLTRGLSNDIIKNLGLCVAIEELASDMTQVNQVKISCLLKNFNENSVSIKFKLNIFRVVQEHLNNILKHAQATYIAIRLLQNKNAVMLGISDDGIGFDTTKRQKGIGVANIKSRATAYEGIADFVSKPGEGCVLTVTFPVNQEVGVN